MGPVPYQQCALDKDGNLKDASEITWYKDKDSEMPIASQPGSKPKGRGQRSRNIARINEIIEAAQESDEDGFHKPQRRKCCRKPKPRPVGDGADTDLDDTSCTALSSDESSEDDDNTAKITNEELADSLPSKTVPTKKHSPLTTKAKSKQQRPQKRSRPTVEEVFDDEAPLLPRPRPRQAFSAIIKKTGVKRQPDLLLL
ncbi:hypothetical protein H0H92_004972 [Tricholoma furcatifolium]|nr:hypothetical protein H0H92_004972 [Tricholoma furcatifolium]